MSSFEQHQNKTIKDSSNVEKMKKKLEQNNSQTMLNFKNGSKIEIIDKHKSSRGVSNKDQQFNFYCNYPDHMIELIGDVELKLWERLYFRILMSPVMKIIKRRKG